MARTERVQQTLDRLKIALELYAGQLDREREDLAFQIGEGQWPDDIKEMKSAQEILGIPIPAQPMLSVSTIDEPITLVENQFRASHLGVNIHPLSEDANQETAEVLQGLYRDIEQKSRANQARLWAFRRGLRAGRGAYEVTKEYDPDSPVPGDQRLMIRRIFRQESVFEDPFAEQPDWSDGEWAIKIADLSPAQFKRRFKNAKLAKYSDDALDTLGAELTDAGYPNWITGTSKESRRIRVAQHFYYEYTTETTEGQNWKGEPTSVETESRQAWFCYTNGIEELGEPVQCDSQDIPLIPSIAEELIPFDEERRWLGMTYRAKDGARLTNYAASNAVKMAALEPLAPYTADPKQIEGYEAFWKRSNTTAFPYLPVHRVIDGQVVEPPQRVQADMSRLGPSMQLLAMGKEFVQSATSTFDPALGKQPTAHRSGRAIVALQDQTQLGTSNFVDTFATVSMMYEACVVLSAIPKIYDRPGRVQQILDPDGTSKYVMLNAPFVPHPQTGRPQPLPYDTSQEQQIADRQVADPNHPAKHYDLSKGRYGVSITIGKSYATKQQEGATEMGEILQAAPAMLPILGPLYFRYRGEPWAAEASKILLKERNHTMPWLSDEPQQGPDPHALAAENAQLKQQLAQAADLIKTKGVEQQGKIAITHMQETAESERADKDREAKLAVAALGAKFETMQNAMQLLQDEIARIGSQQHEAQQGALDRAHDVGMAAQDQAHTLQQGDQAHAQTLEQGQQAAALAPQQSDANLPNQG